MHSLDFIHDHNNTALSFFFYLFLLKSEEEYSCQSGQCIDITNTCDGVRDCDDGSDETLDLCQTFQ